MPRTNLLFCPRSMKKVSSRDRSSYGVSRPRRCTMLFYGLLLCIFVPNYAEATYTAPANCTSVTWVYGSSKMQNISCAGQNFISVYRDGKNGDDVFKYILSNNNISSLAIDEFQYFTNLQYLDLSYNQISSINVDTFSNLTSLKLLNLAANDLKSLPSGLFSATNLTTFNVSRIANFNFGRRRSQSLLVLDLSYTNLASITYEHFEYLVSLEEVNLSNNNLTSLDRQLFKGLTSLRTVDLSWNELVSLENNQVFKQTYGVRTLYLSNNRIVDVDKDFLKDADALTNLDLSHNLISSLDYKVFEDVPDIETIYLSNNLLTSLPDEIFEDLSALTTLYLDNNQLTSLSEQLFQNNPNLEYLYLSANSLSTIPANLWQYQTTLNIDLSSNAFICNCSVRDYLYTAWYDPNKQIENIDSTSCTDATLSQHVYLDYNDASCSRNLGSNCTVTAECLVRNAKCDASICVCSDNYYDTNGDTTAAGLCEAKVSLDYPCPSMDAACAGDNVECTQKSPSSSDTYCLCITDYYDDNPQYLDGTCRLKVGLGEACVSVNNMCMPDNSICGTSSTTCECQSGYYDSNGPTNSDGECLEQLDLGASCNETYQCLPSNSECTNNTCQCSTGYYDFTNLGQCQGPSSFYSCSPDSTSTLEISFSIVEAVTTETECKNHCFEQDERYYHVEGSNLCLCGSPSSSQVCCPMVLASCSGRTYLGTTTLLAEAGTNVTHVLRPTAGFTHSFPVTTSLEAIDQLKAGFGDSATVTTVNASAATFEHTYTHSGEFWLTVSACAASFGVCEDIAIPIKVQVPTENITTYLTGVGNADVSSNLSSSFSATFKMGHDIDLIWSRTFNGVVTKKMGCASGLTQHRHSCIRLESTPATLSAANTACSADGKLLKIDFMVELSEIITVLSAGSETFYLGAQRVGGVWQWLDGTKTVFSDDDLAVSTNGDCLMLDGSSATLTSADCTSSAKYVCMSDPVSCPNGGTLMSDGYCYVLGSTDSASSKTWTDASDYCSSTFGGWLANVTDAATHTNVTSLLTTAGVSTAWIGLHHVNGVYLWGDNSAFDFYNPTYMPTVASNDEDCFVTTDAGSWRARDCSNITDFVCQYSENIQRVTVPNFVLGSADIQISAGQELNHVIPTGGLSATSTDILLFPGLPFSRSGNIQEWAFCSDNLASGGYDIAFLIWRPSCSVGTLVQAGCIPTMFASCSTGAHSCTASTSCSDLEKFCYLSSSCKFMNESCTCNSETSSGTGCGTYGTIPTYEVVSQTMATITQAGQKCYKVSDGDTSIQEGDIVGLQFPTGNNSVRCGSRPSSLDQQKAYSATASDWLVKTDTFPVTYTPVDTTCDFQVTYTQDVVQNLPDNLGYTSLVGSYQLAVSLVESESKQLSVSLEETIDDLAWIYPVLCSASSSSDSFGTVCTELNQVYDFTFAAGRGTSLFSTFSLNTSQAIFFTNSCVSAVVAAVGSSDCNSTMYWSDSPFASFSYNTSTVGTVPVAITVTNDLGHETKSLTIRTEERITGVTFSLVTSSLIPNNVAVDSSTEFEIAVTSGTGLNYSYTVAGSPASSTNSTLSYTFPTIGTFVVQGTVENILSSEKNSITVYAKKAANFTNCQFLNTPYIAAANVSLSLELQCDVNGGSEVSVIWMLSDRTSNITSSVSTASVSPVQWTQLVTFTSVSVVTFKAFPQDPFEAVTVDGNVTVYNQIPSVSAVSNGTDVFLNVTVQFTASVPSSPGDYGTVVYSFDYGDGDTNTSSSGIVTHAYSTGGNYTVSVRASNGPTDETTTIFVAVYEEVTGLNLKYDGPKQTGSTVTFTASVTTGNFISYRFISSSSAFDVTQSSPTYIHTFTNANDYNITVIASNGLSQQSDSLTAYVMNPADLTISGFTMDGNDVSNCVETKIGRNFSVAIIHYSLATVVCDWDFGDGTVYSSTSCSKTYAYPSAGNFTVTVIAKYNPQNAAENITQIVCLHERISSPSMTIVSPIALPATGKITENVTVTVATGDPLTYSWSTNATGVATNTDAVFQVEFSSEGTYFISATVSNEINSLTVNEMVTVVEEISGLTISCAACVQKSGEFYVRNNTAYVFTVTTTTGSGLTFSWDFGDSTAGSGDTNTHIYTAIGTHNLTITGSNAITLSQVEYVTVHIETDILVVTVGNHLWDWLTDVQNTTLKDLDITKTGKFLATVSPTGMDYLEYVWIYETGLAEEITTTDVGEHVYTTTGLKSCTVTVRNSLGNVTSTPFTFYVIEKFNSSYIEVTDNGNSLSGTTESNTYKVALNKQCVFTLSSQQIVTDTVQYFLRLKMKDSGSGSWILQTSTTDNTNSTLAFDFTQEAVYSLEVTITNSLGVASVTVYVEAIEGISGAFINEPVTADGNITLGASLTLTGGVAVGGYLSYNWFYAVAPSGQSLPSTAASNVTITPGDVGQYIVTLEVSNPVSSTLSVNYTINVMVGVSGVAIDVTMPYTDAVKVGTSLIFNGVVTAGTELSYNWDATLAGSSQSTGNVQTFTFLFNTQALYNITLSIENYASSGTAYTEIYSLYDVPAFNLDSSGATFVSSINKYAAPTNTSVTFSSDISNTDYIQFDWKVNGTSELSTETFPKIFASPAEYFVQLNASNLVSSEINGITVLTQDPLIDFSIQNCVGTYLMNTIVTLTASYTGGTDVTVVWTHDTTVTGTATTVQYPALGNYSVNVTGSNYVSHTTNYCWITIQGAVSNLQLAVSQYKFVNYSVTFNVSGDYINPATFTWTFSHGVTLTTTNTETLDLDFAAKGTYTLEVTVANDVSSSKVNITFDVEELACSEPTVTVVGSTHREVLRARAVELSVDVSTNGCTDYTSANSWKIYTATSCSASLTNEYNISGSVETNTPYLQLTSNTLDYGTYCVVFTHSYENTPVVQHKYINLTVFESPLTAVLSGGHTRGASEGSTLIVDASGSYDSDDVAGTTLVYTWTCTQTMGTATAAAVCSQVSAITVSSATLTGLTLTSGESYEINVTVSATGRTSGSTSQTINIYTATTPIASIKCVYCEAYGHFYLTSSRSLAFEGSCDSGCNGSATVTYHWTVTDTTTNTALVIDSSQTSTGTDQQNFVLMHSNIQSDRAYTFMLEITVGTETGSAQMTLQPSSKPSAGNCSVTPIANIVPLFTKVRYSCSNIVDSDTLSGIYYKVLIKSTTDYRKPLVAYFGPKAENDLYVVPFPGTSYSSVDMEITAVNDYGAENDGYQRTLSFQAPTLSSSQTDEIDYIVDQMVTTMRAVVQLNNPALLRQYLLSVLGYLNDQSLNNVGTTAQRKAIRDVIINSLSDLPMSSVYDIQQSASTLEYLVNYPEEISLDTIDKALNEIDALKQQWESTGIPRGADQRDYDSDTALNVNANIQLALQSPSSVVSDGAVLAKFGNLSDLVLEVVSTSSSSQTTTYPSTDAQTQALIEQSMSYNTQLMIIPLKTTVPNEQALEKSSTYYQYITQHVSTDQIIDQYSSVLGMMIKIPDNLLSSQSSYSADSVFQLIYVSKVVQYDYGYSDLEINTVTLSTSFHDTVGDSVSVTILQDPDDATMYMFSKNATPYAINETGLQYSSGYDPLLNMNYSSSTLDPGKTWAVNLNMPDEAGVAVHVQVRANLSSAGAQMRATLYKNGVSYGQQIVATKAMMDNTMHDHLDYTFYIPPDDYGASDAFQVQIDVTETADVFVGQYYTKCEYFKESSSRWDNSGCTPQAESISTVIKCVCDTVIKCDCDHMTSFGGSLFVSPDQLSFADLSIIDIASNPVAVITCSVILGLYIILVIAFRRMDSMDLKRISLIPLCGKDGSFKYEITVVTGRLPGAGTTAHVGIRLFGEYGKSARQHVIKGGAFQRNCSDTFIIAYDVNLGDLKKLQIWHDNQGLSPSWYLSHVIVNDLQTDKKYYFFGNTWLSLEKDNGSIQKELKVADPHEMSKFSHRLNTAMFNSLADKHLWLSLFNRPAQSRFTRIQRVTCCVTILYAFTMVNAMWYGLLKKDNTELGFEGFGWEEVVLALVSNIMVLPVSVGLVFLFKKSRSKPNFLDHVQKPQTAQTLEIEDNCGNSQSGSFESIATGAIPYDLERESTIDSVPHTAALGLHRSRHVAKTPRENTNDSILQKGPSIAVTSASSKSPLWNEDGIMKWPDTVPTYDDGTDSRPSTGSTMAGASGVRQPPVKAGGSTPGAARKSKTLRKGEAGDLLDELDKLENELKESESRSVKSCSSKKSSLRKQTLHKSQWGSLEDILQSDDESVAESSGKLKKRGSTTSQKTRKFNPREDPRINGNGKSWPKSRESVMSRESSGTWAPRGGVTSGLRPGYYSEMTMESRDIKIPVHKEKCMLPPWCIYVAYVICFVLSVFSIIIVILYCFRFGSEESLKWVLALILSLILSFLVIEPLKALLIAVYVVAMFKNVEQDEDDDFIDIHPTFDNSNEKIKDVKFKPVSGFALLQAKEEGRKIYRMNLMIRQFLAYLFYLWLIMVIVFVHFHYNTYLMTKHVENDFIAPTTNDHRNFTNISSIDEFWEWTETVLVESLYKQNSSQDEEHGLLLGEARMRLIRGITSKCRAANAASGLGASSLTDRTCNGDGNYDEDTADYAEGWNHSNSNYSWRHYSAGDLGSTHKIGHVATYGGGGYPQGLGTSSAETDSIISHLKDKGWIDLQTRAIIFEFALYSAGSDMTSLVALLVEFPLTGGVITSYEIQSQKLLWFQKRTVDPLMVLECILFLVIVYSVIHIALQIRERKKQFFKDIWNWYEMLTILMALVSVGMYIGCVVEATNAFNRYLDNQTGFTNYERAVYVHVGMRYLHAWLLFLLMFKVVKQLRFIRFMYVYEKTLSKAVGHLLGTGLIYVILLLVYAQVGYLMYGQLVSGFESVGHTITTLIVMIRGSFDFWPMLDYHPIFSHFYVYSYYTFAYGIMIALVISILTSTYKVVKSQMYYKSTLEMQDYEMIDFMLKRFKLWAGIQKPKPAFRRVRFPGLPSVSSRSSSSYSNRSSSSLQSAQSITGPQFSDVQLRSMMARMAPTWQAVLKRMDKIVALDDEEESLVNKAENEMKNLNWKCRINELERQHKELLSWKDQPSTSGKPPVGDTRQRQSILKRSGAAKDNQDRKAPATVSGAPSRTAASTPDDNNGAQGRRPLSDQGVRVEQASTSKRRASSTEKSKIQTFFKSIKPSKAAWNK